MEPRLKSSFRKSALYLNGVQNAPLKKLTSKRYSAKKSTALASFKPTVAKAKTSVAKAKASVAKAKLNVAKPRLEGAARLRTTPKTNAAKSKTSKTSVKSTRSKVAGTRKSPKTIRKIKVCSCVKNIQPCTQEFKPPDTRMPMERP